MNKFIYIYFKDMRKKSATLKRLEANFDGLMPFHIHTRIFRDFGNAVLVSAFANPRLTDAMDFFVEAPDRTLVLDGYPFFEDYDPDKNWMGQILDGFRTHGKRDIFRKLRGDYCYVEHRPEAVFAAGDFSGFNPIYAYEANGMIAFSNRQKLLHQMLNPKGAVHIDPRAFAWVTAQSSVFGAASPYEGVRLIQSSRYAVIRDGELSFGGFPRFYLDEKYKSRDPHSLVSDAATAITNQASVYQKLPLPNSTLDLTGGKDSRTVLAIAMQTGMMSKIDEVSTIGTDDNPEVLVARALADKLGLKNYRNIVKTRDITMRPSDFSADDAKAFWRGLRQRVTVFDGILSPGLGASVSRSTTLNFTGTGGEVFGNIRTGPGSRLTTVEETHAWVENCQMALDPLGVEREGLKKWQRAQLRRLADTYIASGVPLNDIQYLIWLESRFPWWAGYALSNLMGRRRMFLMMNIDAAGCMFALPSVHKSIQHLHFELLRRAGRPFVDTPFLKFPLDPGLQEFYPDIDIPNEPFLLPEGAPKKIGGVNARLEFAKHDWDELFAYLLDAKDSAVFDITSREKLETIYKKRKDWVVTRHLAVDAIYTLVMLRMIETDDGLPVYQGQKRPNGIIRNTIS